MRFPRRAGSPAASTSHPANDNVPSFSRDGRWIYFASNRSGENQIWRVRAEGGEPIQVTHDRGFVAFESWDGAYIYYTESLTTASTLWRVPAAGGQPVKVLEGVVQRAFTVLEQGIYYIDQPPTEEARLQFLDFATGKSTTVASWLGQQLRLGLTASPDGRTILYSRIDSSIQDLMLVENFHWDLRTADTYSFRIELMRRGRQAALTGCRGIEHVSILARSLSDLVPVVLTGECSKPEREKGMSRVRKGARLTIATTHLFGEGVDVPGWDMLFLASPIAGGPRTLQAVGRVARPAPGKNRAVVVDFVDLKVEMLLNAFKSRQRLYAVGA